MTFVEFLPFAILILISSYVIGSVPTAYILGKLQGVNVFDIGSGNMGGTNVARAMGLGWGILTTLFDAAKGIAAVGLAQYLVPDMQILASVIAAGAAISGHNWSIFASLLYRRYNPDEPFSLRGGKGAATAFGTMLMIVPWQAMVAMLALGIGLVVLTRYVSLGVLMSFTLALSWVVVMVIQDLLPVEYIPYVVLLALLIVWRFRGNIQRLIEGRERRLGERV
jgi:glycerol-3-phosphate acyltransferase PlsY